MNGRHLKVLYLAPPRQSGAMLTAFSFIDEEVLALAERGIEIFIPTYPLPDPPAAESAAHPRVHLCPLPVGTAMAERRETLRLLSRHRRLIPGSAWREPARLYHVGRIQAFAARLARARGIDLIHSHFGWPDGFGGVLTQAETGLPLVASLRGMDVLVDPDIDYGLRLQAFYDDALRTLLAHADLTTHVSDYIRTRAVELGADPSTARTVRKGVDCSFFRPGAAPAREPGTAPVVLTVAGLIKRKGVDGLLHALSRLAPERDFSVVIAGDGPERAALETLCDELGLRGRTTFHGQVPRNDIAALFAACDVFVLASLWEASGNVLLEALASGRPVICTDSGGPPEYVEDGVSGFVVPVADPDAMADKVGRLLDNQALRETLGAAARDRATAQFSYGRMVDSIVAVYEDAIARQREGAGRVQQSGTRPS